ncbi:MAG: murein biosynthesis integral membrane protein MurJ [Acidobacteria bacterium]|nr:murein biosynthesis integral membrane protein MurJ [Acidobacteriota bacterium]MBI3656697.1 murein biosynthesis integral membrane protein MurJ [Acidobacteriota bacterium]
METPSTLKAAGVVSLATLISRILGVVREQVLAAYFTRAATDAYFIAFRIPNLLRDLFAEGALSAAFVPTFTDYRHRSAEQAWHLANLVINALLVVLSLVTLIFFFGAKYLVIMLASGFLQHPGKVDLATKMAQIMSPFLLFVATSAAIMGVLNTGGRFFISALAPAMFNVTNILAGILLSPLMPKIGQEPIVAMAIGSLVGSLGQLLIQLPSAYKIGYRYRLTLIWRDPGLRRIGRLMLPAIFGLAATQINFIIDNQFSSRFGDGPVSWLNYAFRLMQLPIGLFGVAIATVNLTAVSRDAALNDMVKLKATLARSIRFALLLTLPATAGLIALRHPIIRVLYEHGKFTAQHTQFTADALLYYALGLFSYSAVKIIVPTFYALNDSKLPVIASALTVLLKIGLNFVLTGFLGFTGLALATAMAATINLMFLWVCLCRRVGSFTDQGISSAFLKITTLSAGMGILCFYSYQALGHTAGLSLASFWKSCLALVLCIGLGLALTFFIGLGLRIREIDDLKLAVARRFLRA